MTKEELEAKVNKQQSIINIRKGTFKNAKRPL